MKRVGKIAVSLPHFLLKSVEDARTMTGESRSAFVARALQALIAQQQEKEEVRRYVEGYRRMPDTGPEIAGARASARQAVRYEEWDEAR